MKMEKMGLYSIVDLLKVYFSLIIKANENK